MKYFHQTYTRYTLRKNCLYSEFFWPAFSRIRTEYGDLLCKSPYSVRMQETVGKKNSKYKHFLRTDTQCFFLVNPLTPGVH